MNSENDFSIDERISLLSVEMQSLQSRLMKYDDLIWQTRGWLITLIVALLGWAIAEAQDQIQKLASFSLLLVLLFWLRETFFRANEWYKYIVRYRTIRDAFRDKTSLMEPALLDFSGTYGIRPTHGQRMQKAVYRAEPALFYATLALVVLLIGLGLAE